MTGIEKAKRLTGEALTILEENKTPVVAIQKLLEAAIEIEGETIAFDYLGHNVRSCHNPVGCALYSAREAVETYISQKQRRRRSRSKRII